MLKSLESLQFHQLISSPLPLQEVARHYAIGLTSEVVGAIQTATDPVARQYVPDLQELVTLPDEVNDPIGDEPHEVTKGLIHRYQDRVLFKVTPICAVYCRFCFRREMVGPGHETLNAEDMAAAYQYIEQHSEIDEVILSGGDPLILSPRRLQEILQRLGSIQHLRLIRIHSRIPVADPQRITQALCDSLQTTKTLNIAVHCNHPQELTGNAWQAVKQLRNAGIQLLSQSVLLKGINNDMASLEELYRAFAELGIKAYYLHHPDKAPGTAHFRVRIEEGQKLMRSLRGRLPGHALPTYVLDIPGGFGKVPITPEWVSKCEKGYHVKDITGRKHFYQE